ncbi:MAG TPA: hypothetical protein VN709_11585 [Terriglobales bacterium]|nr:hypothetical protein [Terriglobales bacterium]
MSPFRRALARSGRHLLGAFGRAFRRIGLQVSAVIYLALALSFAAEAFKRWHREHLALGRHAPLLQMAGVTEVEWVVALVLLYFGISSWLRASQHP